MPFYALSVKYSIKVILLLLVLMGFSKASTSCESAYAASLAKQFHLPGSEGIPHSAMWSFQKLSVL